MSLSKYSSLSIKRSQLRSITDIFTLNACSSFDQFVTEWVVSMCLGEALDICNAAFNNRWERRESIKKRVESVVSEETTYVHDVVSQKEIITNKQREVGGSGCSRVMTSANRDLWRVVRLKIHYRKSTAEWGKNNCARKSHNRAFSTCFRFVRTLHFLSVYFKPLIKSPLDVFIPFSYFSLRFCEN